MGFEDIEAWNRSCRLSAAIYKCLQDCRDSGFKDQITCGGLSVPSNIAEGFEHKDDEDAIEFFNTAKSSCGVLLTQVHIGMEVGYIPKDIGLMWKNEAEQLSKMLTALIESRSNS